MKVPNGCLRITLGFELTTKQMCLISLLFSYYGLICYIIGLQIYILTIANYSDIIIGSLMLADSAHFLGQEILKSDTLHSWNI